MLIAHRPYPWLRNGLLQFAALVLAAGCAIAAPGARTESRDDDVDPPARVGRIALLAGPVTLTDLRDGDAEAATLNWPITSQHRLSTGRLGRAEVRIGSLAVRLDEETDVDFSRVDDEAIQIVVQRGTVALRVRNRELLREIDLLTPRDRIALEDVGRYRIDVDRAAGITAVTAHVGYARISVGRNTFVVQSGQRGEASSYPLVSFKLVTPAPDAFDDWVAARDRRDDALRSRHYVSEETTGIESLDEYGQWRVVESHGPVWFPSGVPVGWAPYRYGRWAWIAPWGWTWIDEAPWGFAPFHYGRWVIVGGVWGWVPGVIVPRPVYAPALVVWYGTPGVSVGVTIGSPVGWFPLGPREVFIPYYRCSRRHINYVNVQHIANINHITVINPPPRYAHQQPGHSTWTLGDALLRRMPRPARSIRAERSRTAAGTNSTSDRSRASSRRPPSSGAWTATAFASCPRRSHARKRRRSACSRRLPALQNPRRSVRAHAASRLNRGNRRSASCPKASRRRPTFPRRAVVRSRASMRRGSNSRASRRRVRSRRGNASDRSQRSAGRSKAGRGPSRSSSNRVTKVEASCRRARADAQQRPRAIV